MLGVLGFGVTAILFFVFSRTLKSSNKKKQLILTDYGRAYSVLALTFTVYAIGAAFGTSRVLSLSILVGNGLLLIATIPLLNILLITNRYRKQALYAFAIVGLGMILVRVFLFYPTPYMYKSILFFNSQRFVSFMLSSTFLLIWLPVNLRIARLMTHKAHGNMKSIYAFLYALATFSAIIFMLSKRPITLVLSFIALSLCFLLLITSNVKINPEVEALHHAAKQS